MDTENEAAVCVACDNRLGMGGKCPIHGDLTARSTESDSQRLAEYVRNHQCWNADRNVTIADWHRGIIAIEAEAVAHATESDASRIGGLLAIVGDAEANDLPIHVATGATCAEHDQAATERPRTEPLDVRQAIEEISGELSHYDLSDDPGYIKVPTERVRAILRARLSPPAATPTEGSTDD